MIRTCDNIKRTIIVSEGNLRNSHISVTGLHSLFPQDVLGGSKRSNATNGIPICIHLEGLNRAVETDIGRDSKTGRPRRQFRGRAWVRQFFMHHKVQAGDSLTIERIGERTYRLFHETQRVQLVEGAAPRVVEFFAGIGLVRLALERQGLKVVFANDIDADKLEIYRQNFPIDHFRLEDIHNLTPHDIPDCEIVTASFPCTDLSIAGAMNGINSGESSAFWGAIRLVEEMKDRRPPILMLENVPGFLMAHEGKDFKSAMLALNDLGYSVDAFFLDAADFVPQSRLRLFVVGKLNVEQTTPFGLTTSRLRPPAIMEFVNAHPEIRWNLRRLPAPRQQGHALESILEDLPDTHDSWWNRERADYFMNQLSERHLRVAKEMIQRGTYSYGTAFRRVRKGRSMAELRTDGLAGCLRTPKGGSGRQILFKAGRGKYKVRLLTARECARLQGVPNSYQINVPLNQALFGFGDAVCVPVIEWIAEHYLLPCLKEIH